MHIHNRSFYGELKKTTTKKPTMYVAIEIQIKQHICPRLTANIESQGPVVQSVVSFTSSLRVISLTVLADSIHNILIYFAEKM